MAFGAAVSPTLFVAVLVLLTSSERPRSRAVAFIVGAAAPLVLIAALGMSVFRHAASGHPQISPVVDLTFGVVLLLLGTHTLRTPATRQHKSSRSRPAGPVASAVLGAVLMVTNFSSLALFVPAVKEVAVATSLGTADRVLVLTVTVVVSLLAVLVPLLLFTLAPGKAAALLGPPLAWTRAHARATGVAVCFVFGAYLCIKAAIRM